MTKGAIAVPRVTNAKPRGDGVPDRMGAVFVAESKQREMSRTRNCIREPAPGGGEQ